MGRNNYTGLLYTEPSMLEGFARVLDVGGVFDDENDSSTEAEADWIALASDWYAVGADLYHSTRNYRSRSSEPAPHARRDPAR